MNDYMAPGQLMGQQLQGALREAAASADNNRANLAARQLKQQEMAKAMELDFTLSDKLMPVNKELAFEHFNKALAPMGRSVEMQDFDVAHTIFSQAAELKQKGDLVGMQMLLKQSDKYLVNLADRQKAISMETEGRQDMASRQAQAVQGLQAENPQLARAKSLVDLAGMVGGDLTRVDPDQLVSLTGTTDPTEQNNRLIQSQAMIEGHQAITRHMTSLFSLDPTSFVQAAHTTAQAVANPEVLAKGRISDLLQKPDRTDLEHRELEAKVSVYGNPQLQAAMQIKSAQRDAEQIRSQLEDTQGRLSAIQTHRDAYDQAQEGASSLKYAAPAAQAGVFHRTEEQGGGISTRHMMTVQEHSLGPDPVAIPLLVPGNEHLGTKVQGHETDANGVPIPGGATAPGMDLSEVPRVDIERAIQWAVDHPEVVRSASLYQSAGAAKDAFIPITDNQAKEYFLREGTRQVEGQAFLAKQSGRIESLEQTATEAERQAMDLKQRQLGALPGQKELIGSQLKEFQSMAKANRAVARLLRDENPYMIEQRRAEMALLDDPKQKAEAQKALTALEAQRDTDVEIVEGERARLERREKILRGKQPEADRKAEQEENLRSAAQAVDRIVARGGSLTAAVRDAASTFGVSASDLAKAQKEARGVGVPEAQLSLLDATQAFRKANGRDPEPGEVNGILQKVLRSYPGVKGDDVLPVLKDPNRPLTQVSLYDPKQNVQEAGKLANVNQAIQEMRDVRTVLMNPDGTVNRKNLFAATLNLPFTAGRGAQQMLEKGVEIKLRAATGAAARPDEMKMYMRLFSPSNLDSDDTIKYKLDSFENWLQTVADTTDPLGSLRQRAHEMLNEGTVGMLQTPEYKELRQKFPQASASEIVKFLRQRGK